MGEKRTLRTQGRGATQALPRQPGAAFRAAAGKSLPFPELENIPHRGPTEKEKNELIFTQKKIDSLDREDLYSLASVMKSCSKWKRFFNISSESEAMDALPFFRRFIRAMKSYISDAPTERAVLAMQDLAELIRMDVPSISYVFTELCSEDPRREVKYGAFRFLESNSGLLIRATDFHSPNGHRMFEQFGILLQTYAELSFISEESLFNEVLNGKKPSPVPFDEAATMSICSFLFCHKEALLRSREGIGLLPYAIAWSADHYINEGAKIDFMEDGLFHLPRGFRTDIFLKVVMFANSGPVRECALDLLVEMGVYKLKRNDEIGNLVDKVWIDALLQITFERMYGRLPGNIVLPDTCLLH